MRTLSGGRLPRLAFCSKPHSVQEDVSLGELADSCQRVLHNTHDGPVGLGCDDHTGHHSQLLDLCPGLQRLGQVEIHLIPIKVSIVWCGDTSEETRNENCHIKKTEKKKTL